MVARILAAIAVVLVASEAISTAAAQELAPPSSPIAQTALGYQGTYAGQCWEFVKNVVSEATGRHIGFDYRQGFFDAGAIEVAVSDARSGDVIQIANDADTTPTADYPGLHTAIILDNRGNNLFRIIDSNSNFDGIVRIRDNYSPGAAAARYPGLTFHIYRIDGDGPPVAAPASSRGQGTSPVHPTGDGVSWIKVGDRLRTSTPGDVLRLRAAPNGPILGVLGDGTPVEVDEIDGVAAGYHWAHIRSPAGEGFVAMEYLVDDGASATAPAASTTGGTVALSRFRSVVPGLESDP